MSGENFFLVKIKESGEKVEFIIGSDFIASVCKMIQCKCHKSKNLLCEIEKNAAEKYAEYLVKQKKLYGNGRT